MKAIKKTIETISHELHRTTTFWGYRNRSIWSILERLQACSSTRCHLANSGAMRDEADPGTNFSRFAVRVHERVSFS